MNVGEMQRKLSLWAEQDENHKFYDLYHLLYDKSWLRLAHDYVAQNAGSKTAGCDGINMRAFDEELESNLQQLAEELKSETFEPYPVRRVNIRKPNGRFRPLGIPSVKDRIVQEALRMILEPIYEADFCQISFGFRPNRCTMDAIKRITWSTQESKKFFWIVEGDISSYFDSICHRRLVKLLRSRIKDEKIIRLIWKFLRAGVMEGKLFKDTKLGVPQGGIVSPLLSNLYLHQLDKYMEKYTGLPQKEKTRRREQGLANFVYVRFADDFAALCNGTREQAEELREELCAFLMTDLRLKLSKEKTKITHLNDGFKFLGFWIERCRASKGVRTKTLIPKEAVDKLRHQIAAITAPATHNDSVNATILALNRTISGWCHYYQYTGNRGTIFNRLGNETFWRMAYWLARKFKLAMPEVMRRYRQGNTFATEKYRLKMPDEYPGRIYKKSFNKPNPYTTQERIRREELRPEPYWTGYEPRLGMMDLRPQVLERDGYICQMCDRPITEHTAQVDHIKPVKRHKRPVDANTLENLWTLCTSCHEWKTEYDQRMES